MNIFTEIDPIRAIRWDDPSLSWGLVPTMGFLHEGHLSLVRHARQENDRVGVSIFVNPSQFNESSDLEAYPRDLERDLALLRQEGADLVWTPTPEVVYPTYYQTYIEVEEMTTPLEGAARPGHFRGVATVVAKLFNVFQPHRAYFGQKDAQQVAVIKRMGEDLNFNLEIVACPTVRDKDGLALSSRNVNLSPEARQQAVCLYQALLVAQSAIEAEERSVSQIKEQMQATIEQNELAKIDYISLANAETLQELTQLTNDSVLISLAVFVGGVRLIDNMVIAN